MAHCVSNPDNKAVRKSDVIPLHKIIESRANNVFILQSELVMFKQHAYCDRNLLCVQAISRLQNPDCFRKDKVRNPSTCRHKGFSTVSLAHIISNN